MRYKFSSLAILLSFASMYAHSEVTPTIVARSQGRDAVSKMVGVSDKVHLYDHGWYMNVSAMPEYTRTFRGDKLAHCLFGDDLTGCNTILIQGSDVANRNAKAWLADYFYLPPDFDGYFQVRPQIQNFLVELDLYAGLDEILTGAYVRLYGPLTWTKWQLNYSEKCDVDTTHSFRPGYFSIDTIANDQLLHSFAEYAAGDSPLNTSGTADQPTIGTAFQGLQYAKILPCSRTRTGFAELRMEAGWNFLQGDNYHLGLNLQLAAPTGSKRQAEYAFDAVVGNGNHWEVGGGLTGHYVFWRSCDEDKHGGLYVDLSVTHLNNSKEQRTFDLCDRPNSRYMLAEKLERPVTFLTAADTSADTAPADAVAPIAQFAGVFAPVANLTTVNVDVRVGVQADLVALFNYTTRNWSFDLGYNFWARTAEKFSYPLDTNDQCCPSLCSCECDTWALKGDAAVFGYLTATGPRK